MQILLLPPIGTLPVPDQHVEVTVQQQNHILFQLRKVQLYWHWLIAISGVLYERRLYHHHTVRDRLSHQAGLMVESLVGRGAERIDDA